MHTNPLIPQIHIAKTLLTCGLTVLLLSGCDNAGNKPVPLKINKLEYFESPGVNVLVFSNWYNGNFSDSKMAGVEIIHHEVRTATNGDVRLSPTPGQWDPIPAFVEKKVDRDSNRIEAYLEYPDYHFKYMIRAEASGGEMLLSVHISEPLPAELEGKAGFNLEFLPSAYFERAYLMDGKTGIFPLYPGGPMERTAAGVVEPQAIARGCSLTLAPEDASRRITIRTTDNELALYDGRNQAQNGWYVVRSLMPAGKTGKVLEWHLTAGTVPGWIRPPVIAYSQAGYHPGQEKIAVIELDKNDTRRPDARLLHIAADGKYTEKYSAKAVSWGKYLRYNYLKFNFSQVTDSGLYVIEYGDIRTLPFRIAQGVYDLAWQPTLDVFFPVQMDHMFVNEAYRVWHGAAHMDDALQAPVNHEHFDLYAQGPSTDTPYKPGEHIPGLNTGGWFDAGDFDIRTQSQYAVVLRLVMTWEMFRPDRDETTVDQERLYTDIHVPDGKPDLLQQVEHGTLQLLAQFKAVGHAVNGIIEPHLSQYTHLGDAVTITDNLIYDPQLDEDESNGFHSGKPDDRWAFTTRSTALDYGSIAALAAASRALRGYNDPLAEECLATAKRVWEREHRKAPDSFRHGNTTGGWLEGEELNAAAELLICTGKPQYSGRIRELWPVIRERFAFLAVPAIRVMSFMDESYKDSLEVLVRSYKDMTAAFTGENPFGVPVTGGGWAGSGWAIEFGITNYYLHKAFPEIIGPENTFRGLHYIYGCHPGSNISFVSGVGTHSKQVAYGTNRADYSFIAGGIVPGVLILPPDFPENKEDWPFLWGENEYVINLGSSYIFLVNAAIDLLRE